MANGALVNFAAGETAPRSRGRFDLPWYQAACRKLLNFVAEVQGPARYRPGFRYAGHTRRGQRARLISFQLNDSQAYMLEFTPGYMRVYKDQSILKTTETVLTGVTQANPAIITVNDATNLDDGDEILISDVGGMTQLEGRRFVLSHKSGSTFRLNHPVTGVAVNSSSYDAWTTGGTVSKIYELESPYLDGELDDIQFAQSNTVLYLAHYLYAPYKVTVDSADGFTLSTFVRTNDPFTAQADTLNVAGVQTNNPAVVLFASGSSIVDGAVYTFAAVGGTTQLNGNSYRLEVFTDESSPLPRARLRDETTGSYVNGSAFSAWTSGGTATPAEEHPISVAFHEGRLGYFGTDQRPDCFFLSRTPDSSGNNRYDDFTGGTNADHACFFQLAPVNGHVDYISWARGTVNFLFLGTFGGPYRVSGAGIDQPITPTSINVRQMGSFGCEATMAVGGEQVYYLQRGGTTVRAPKLGNAYLGTFDLADMCLNADHIANSRLQKLVFQIGTPDVLWVSREDGLLAGMSVEGSEEVAGWHRHRLGGTDAAVVDIQISQRTDKNDLLWVVVSRVIGGVTQYFVEYMADDVQFPDPEDFYSGDGNEAVDFSAWVNAVYRLQEQYIHLDSAVSYDGSDRGTAADAYLTPSAVTGTDVHFTSSSNVFRSDDVGAELWKKPSAVTGAGAGRAVITQYVSATEVVCDILVDFDSTDEVAPGDWYFATDVIRGAWHLEGEEVAVVTDGAVYSDGGLSGDYPTVTVASGSVTLDNPAAVVHLGFPYEGFVESHNLELGGRSGPAQSKPRNIVELFVRFMSTLGVDYGTDLYRLAKIPQRAANAVSSRPAPVFSGIRKLHYSDRWSAQDEKRVIIAQRLPLPAVVQFIDVRYDTTDEG